MEQANGTFQGRLVTELRLAGASTISEANLVLEEFLPRFNERFGLGELSRRQAAKELAIGYATLSRLLDNRPQPLDQSANKLSLAASAVDDRAINAYAKVVY